ncbi:MAG: transcriptional repressor LexA [Gammaproteobacteria bacterium]|nr:transcriptional repressor LexA [Gammaproteobacteria bacterium]
MPTLLEKRILNFIHAFIVKHGHSPTLVEIGNAMNISSKGTIHRYVQNLRNKGMLAQPERGWRGIRLADDALSNSTTLPLVGRIAAGQPIEAIHNQEEINLTEMFVGKDRYALQIKGDSMIDIGILDGDIVVIEPQNTAQFGDVVVALIDDQEATLKRYKRLKDGRIELSPENQDLQPMIYDASRVKIQGLLVGQLRSY